MQRLLISLSRLLDRFIKTPEPELPPVVPHNLGGNPDGVFTNQVRTPLEYYTEEVFDEEDNFYIRVQYVCACGEPVFKMLTEGFGFGCDHCDSICRTEDCKICYNLNSVDFGDPDA